jgi:hypothetical protein
LDHESFYSDFYWWALIRLLQALGAYGLRGTVEKKGVFLQSIPVGLENVNFILNQISEDQKIPELKRCLLRLIDGRSGYPSEPDYFDGLTITVTSFSYQKSYPDDISGNGGGFVYDCRFLSNPGREQKYRELTGFDREVVDFFFEKGDMEIFLREVEKQLSMVIASYQKQSYKHLMVSFGCTGGRHRSVYAARRISEYLSKIDNLRVIEKHRELKQWPGK